MLKKILVALDGSENSERAIPWVKLHARREHAQVVLLRIVPADDYGRDWIPAETLKAKEYLQGIERELNYSGMPVKVAVRQGRPVEEIVRAAASEKADLVIIATRGASPVTRWVLGGVTEQVIRRSPVPVLVVQSRTPMPKQGRVRRIVVPVDGSRRAEGSILWAAGIAKLIKAQLHLVHVKPIEPAGRAATHEDFKNRMLKTVAGLRKNGVRAVFRLQQGDPATRILEYADRQDLILTTTHGFGGFKRWILGSVAEKLVHEAHVPVLIFKGAEQVKGRVTAS